MNLTTVPSRLKDISLAGLFITEPLVSPIRNIQLQQPHSASFEFFLWTSKGSRDLFIEYGAGSLSCSMNDFDQGCERVLEKTMKYIQLYQWKAVNHISLDFRNCYDLSNKGLDMLMLGIGQNFNRLKSLTLLFTSCQKITDQGVEKLGVHISQSLQHLKELDISLSDCCWISDKGLKLLGSSLSKYYDQFTSLTLDFTNCWRVTDEGVRGLAKTIGKKLYKLNQLTIKCSFCTEITDDGFMELVKNIGRYLIHLKKLTLIPSFCTGLTDQSLLVLKSETEKKRGQLNHLVLDFKGCPRISSGVREVLDQAFSSLETFSFIN